MNNLITSPVFPIPPAFNNAGKLDTGSIDKYIDFLDKEGVEVIMTTAGTSQFNLLTIDEVLEFNATCGKFAKHAILGIPMLSTKLGIDFISKMNELKLDNCSLLLLYPDRYYGDEAILDHFNSLADTSIYPCFIHGMFMRNSTGGTYNFTANLVNKIAKHSNIIGMKEETTNIGSAYKVCKDIDTDNFTIIVAGGSMKRFLALHATGVQTFLSGVGNILPKIDIDFHKHLTTGNLAEAYNIVNEYENIFFDVFMKYGWHQSLREALYIEGHYTENTRQPFPRATTVAINDIQTIIKTIKEKTNEN